MYLGSKVRPSPAPCASTGEQLGGVQAGAHSRTRLLPIRPLAGLPSLLPVLTPAWHYPPPPFWQAYAITITVGLLTMVYTAYGGLFISIITDQVQGAHAGQPWLGPPSRGPARPQEQCQPPAPGPNCAPLLARRPRRRPAANYALALLLALL